MSLWSQPLHRAFAVGCGTVLFATLSVPYSVAGDDVNVPVEEMPIVRTEEDVERGKANIRSVIDELSELFSNEAAEPQLTPARKPIEPPYCKVIQGSSGRSTLVFRPRFTAAKQMFKALEGVLTGNTLIEALEEQNEILISATDSEIKSYQDILLAMDVPAPQILIEAKVVEVFFSDGMQRNLSLNFEGKRYNVGANAEVPGVTNQPTTGLGGNFTPYSGKDSMNIAFQWLLTAQDAKVLASPNILISRNEVSRIVTGEEIPIQEATTSGNNLSLSTNFKNVGVSLEVEPSMINRDNVTLRIYPKVSNVVRYENVSAGSGTNYPVPVISARSVETHLRMQDKQIVMMGGLYNSRNTLQQQRIPVLSDLPLIGELFTGKNESKEVTQLIFFLKIHIIPPEQVPSGVFYNFDELGKSSEKLGQVVEYSDSFPLHKTSVENLATELRDAMPGEAVKRREEFKRQQQEQQEWSFDAGELSGNDGQKK